MLQAKKKRLDKLKQPERMLMVASSPHVHSGDSVEKIMWTAVATLIPASLVGVYFFGFGAIKVITICVLGSLIFEGVIQKLLGKPVTVSDGSAAITGLLLALNLPAGAPWWLCMIGVLVAIGIGKQAYGGLGHNIFNPALVARVFLLISFPSHMTTWPNPAPLFSKSVTDAVTGATPLGLFKEQGEINRSLADLFLGNTGGCVGEVSAVALLLGAAFLIYKKYITWHIPVSFIGTVLAFAFLFNAIDPSLFAGPLFHLVSGGLLIGALFMATDMVTSPISPKGQLIFGFGCGFLTIAIRLFSGYPEGVSFAILLMNAATPLIDRWTLPKKFGFVPPLKEKKEEA